MVYTNRLLNKAGNYAIHSFLLMHYLPQRCLQKNTKRFYSNGESHICQSSWRRVVVWTSPDNNGAKQGLANGFKRNKVRYHAHVTWHNYRSRGNRLFGLERADITVHLPSLAIRQTEKMLLTDLCSLPFFSWNLLSWFFSGGTYQDTC